MRLARKMGSHFIKKFGGNYGRTLPTAFTYGPIMVHESVPTATECVFKSHPRRVLSVSYALPSPFPGGNTVRTPSVPMFSLLSSL
jgi:hypothetical protein